MIHMNSAAVIWLKSTFLVRYSSRWFGGHYTRFQTKSWEGLISIRTCPINRKLMTTFQVKRSMETCSKVKAMSSAKHISLTEEIHILSTICRKIGPTTCSQQNEVHGRAVLLIGSTLIQMLQPYRVDPMPMPRKRHPGST